jgi:N-acetylglucosaminyldiphosphoundecaprenol N-acetyl-beta-D-mannosaminyltransferase
MKSTSGESTAGETESTQPEAVDFEFATSPRQRQSDLPFAEDLEFPLSAATTSGKKSKDLIIAGIPIANLSVDEAVALIDEMISIGGPHFGAVINAAKVVAAERDPDLKRALLDADFVTADGMSVVWASRLLGPRLKQRVTGIDLFERLLAHAEEQQLSVYFLGAQDESVRGVVEFSKHRYPSLRIAGYHDGYFRESENEMVCDEIMHSRADLLFVAMGSPKQELWISSNLLSTGVRFALGVGGSFDHLSGKVQRAPVWMQKSGLEWLHRFMREPARLWKRYLIGNSAFILLIIRQLVGGSRTPKT